MRRSGLNLARKPMTSESMDGDLEAAGMEYGGEEGGEEGAEEMEAPDITGFQQAVEEDRSQRGEMSEEEFDAWDMEWRKRGKQAGLDEQEVDALMDSIWEGEGSEPTGYYD